MFTLYIAITAISILKKCIFSTQFDVHVRKEVKESELPAVFSCRHPSLFVNETELKGRE